MKKDGEKLIDVEELHTRQSNALDALVLEGLTPQGTEEGGGRGARQSQGGLQSLFKGHADADAVFGSQKCFKGEGQGLVCI